MNRFGPRADAAGKVDVMVGREFFLEGATVRPVRMLPPFNDARTIFRSRALMGGQPLIFPSATAFFPPLMASLSMVISVSSVKRALPAFCMTPAQDDARWVFHEQAKGIAITGNLLP